MEFRDPFQEVLLYRPSDRRPYDLVVLKESEEADLYGVCRVQILRDVEFHVLGYSYRVAPLPHTVGSVIENVVCQGQAWEYGVNVARDQWHLRSDGHSHIVGTSQIDGFILDGRLYVTCTQRDAIDPRKPAPPVSGLPLPDDPESPADGHAGTENAAS